ncbi:MAG: SCO family protein [Solirubrobacterales bacterium]|nr:SCO family protein [Solirubrobacterales bacterium]
MTLRRARQIAIAGAVLLAVLLVVLSVLARVNKNSATTTAGASAGVPAPVAIGTALERPRPVPAVQLIDENGTTYPLPAAWHGKWVVLAPSLTLCHEVCPMTTGALMELTAQLRQAGLSSQVVVATATVDPWRDTPARLRAYRKLTGADFTMLTGTQTEIRRLWKFFGVYYARVPQGKPPDVDWMTHKPETFDVQHTDAVFVVDPAGQERIVDEGMPDVGGRLSATLRSLLSSAGQANLAHPELPWTATEIREDLYSLMGRTIPASELPKSGIPTPAAAQQALAGSPGALAALHRQAGQLVGSASALMARLHSLRGYPVVLNAWASWCGPCRAEFGILASASTTYGKRVAFVGVNTNDTTSDARSFLAQHPVSYPSYESSSSQLSSLAVLEGLPTTIFVAPSGKVVNVHAGQYDTGAALDNDIAHYALGS